MSICYHQTVFFHKCGHTERFAQHTSECAVIGPTAVPPGLPDVDRHIVLLNPRDPSSMVGAGHRTISGNCNLRLSWIQIRPQGCKLCSADGGSTKHPIGCLSFENLRERRRIWLGAFRATQDRVYVMDELREKIKCCKYSLPRMQLEAALQKLELYHEKRKQYRKRTWFDGLSRRHRCQIEKGVPAMKRTYVCPGTEHMVGAGNIFQELDPASLADEGDCGVCRLPLNDVERRVAKIPCGHIYHFEDYCIVRWFQKGHVDCPYCRARFDLRPIPDWNDVRFFYHSNHSYPRVISGYVQTADEWREDEINCNDSDTEPESWYTDGDDSGDSADDQDNDVDNHEVDDVADIAV
ncbi:hypothetical protein DL98DRAFT_596968 [Cadophora sp. DSE1049]|nr:hypothetical protein DL98DRAFT_596968 [Cadophora sp. DSE1049]